MGGGGEGELPGILPRFGVWTTPENAHGHGVLVL